MSAKPKDLAEHIKVDLFSLRSDEQRVEFIKALGFCPICGNRFCSGPDEEHGIGDEYD